MKLNSITTIEFKNISLLSALTRGIHTQGQMIAPGGSCCTIGCSCSCSCGATNKVE